MIKVPKHVYDPPNTIPSSLDDKVHKIDHGINVSRLKCNHIFDENYMDYSLTGEEIKVDIIQSEDQQLQSNTFDSEGLENDESSEAEELDNESSEDEKDSSEYSEHQNYGTVTSKDESSREESIVPRDSSIF